MARTLPDNISVAIPNWNGEAVLPECLNSLRRALRRAGAGNHVDIVIADDQSTDRAPEIVKRDYPEVRWLDMPQRSGFGVVANTAVTACANDYVLLLNNDVYVEEDFFLHWHPHFEDPKMFAVASWMLRMDRKTVDSGRRVAVWDKGLIRHWVVEHRFERPQPTLYACGGASVYDKAKFALIGGFDPLFKPMYTEDLDLSYVAWKRGWKVMYEPKCMVYHHASFSSDRSMKRRLRFMTDTKNHYLFVWKNITDPALFRRHLAWLPLRVVAAPFHGRRMLAAAFFVALKQWGQAMRQRAAMQRVQMVSDRAIFELFRPTADDLAHSPYRGIAGAA
jgi:GT2 family glycosyltransferase